MDKEYLDHIISSPYIQEGKWDQLKKKMSQGLKAGASALGFPFKSSVPVQQASSPTVSSEKVEQKTDLAAIVDKTIDIIIDAVKSDTSRSELYLGPKQKELPKTWEEPPLTKEAEIPVPGKKGEEEVGEIEGEFLYNFHSRYDKMKHFSIEIKPIHVSKMVTLPASGKTKEITVFWVNKEGLNEIHVRAKGIGPDEKTSQSMLFKFYDDQVSPQTATGKQFNIENILQQSHPLDENPLSYADPNLVANIKKKKDDLFRAFYATTLRKGMEFKAKKKGLLPLTMDNAGNVSLQTKAGKKPLNVPEIKAKLYSAAPEEAEKWEASLDQIGYFEKFPGMKPASLKEYPSFNDAILALRQLGTAKDDAEFLAKTAWYQLRSQGKKPEEITSGDITTMAYKKPHPAVKPAEEPTPVSAPAGKPVGGATVSAPVSTEKPKPEIAPAKKIGFDVDDEGSVTGVHPKTGKAIVWKYPHRPPDAVEDELKKDPEKWKKYVEGRAKVKTSTQAKKALKEPSLSEEIINPFQIDNFFLY